MAEKKVFMIEVSNENKPNDEKLFFDDQTDFLKEIDKQKALGSKIINVWAGTMTDR